LIRWITDRVAVGSWRDAEDHGRLRELGIEAILDLGWREPHPHEGFTYRWNLIWPAGPYLSPDQVKPALKFLLNQVFVKRRKVLVHCGDGLDRAPTIVMLFLYVTGYDLDSAFSLIKQKAPEAHPRVDWCSNRLIWEICTSVMRGAIFEQHHFKKWYRQGTSLLSVEYGSIFDYGMNSKFSISDWVPGVTIMNMMWNSSDRLPFSSNSFDNICFIDSLSMMPNPMGMLQEAHRVLKDEGRLFIQNLHGVRAQRPFYINELNLHMLTEITLRRLLNQAGFFIDYCVRWGMNIVAYATKTERENEDLRLLGPEEAHEVVEFIRGKGFEAYPSGGVFRWGFSAQDVDVHIVKDEGGKCGELVKGLKFPFRVVVECHPCEKKYDIDPNGTITEGEYRHRPIDIDLETSKLVYKMGYTVKSYWEKMFSGRPEAKILLGDASV